MAIRILHIVGGMNRAGIETWLMHVLRHADRQRLHMDFVVHTTDPCAYDREVLALGSRIIPCLYPTRPWLYQAHLKRALRDYGPYDIVHSHVHHYSGLTLRWAWQAGIPMRIAHSHNDTTSLRQQVGPLRRAYLDLTTRWIRRYATKCLACSDSAGEALMGAAWHTDPRCRTLLYGIDLAPFEERSSSDQMRAQLGIDPKAFVVGHVGRFVPQKNHTFLLKVFAEVDRSLSGACLLLVGDGPLRPQVVQQAADLGLSDRVVLAGVRSDVPHLMMAAMDVFLFPSSYEGLGLVLIEAQAAGLPCIISDVVPPEADVNGSLVERLSLSAAPSSWADAAIRLGRLPKRRRAALSVVAKSPFTIEASVKRLEAIYSA